MDELLREFLTETGENLDRVDAQLVRLEHEPNDAHILSNIFRLVHTIKGTCGFLELPRLEALTHAAETLMSKFRDGMPVTGDAVTLVLTTIDRVKTILDELEKSGREPAGEDADLIERLAATASQRSQPPSGSGLTMSPEAAERAGDIGKPAGETTEQPPSHSIRVSVDTLDQLMTTVSELVLSRNQLLEIVRRHGDSEFNVPLQRLSNVTAQLQEGVMKTRMQPIGYAWQKLPRIVRDLAAELGKDIGLEMHGAETELDRQVLDLVKDPLTHLVRNCADHGIETPTERSAAGKPCKGTIRLSACHQGGYVIIEVADDGRGLDTAGIKAKAVEMGLAGEAELSAKPQNEINNLIFSPGFSTAAKVTNVSGRGVGMDVVRSNIEQIGGAVGVKTVAGSGTVFTIRIPLTLAIVPALIVAVGDQRFAIPQLAVLELVRVGAANRVERIKDACVLRLRNELVPLAHLRDVMRLGNWTNEDGFVVVMQVGNQIFGAIVDNVFHTEEIVIKPMSSRLRHIEIFSGTTILGDGSVILILDPSGVAQSLGCVAQALSPALLDLRPPEESFREDTVSLLIFRAGSHRQKAVPLSLVTRLEEVDCHRIEVSDGRHLLQYRGQLMPLLHVEAGRGVKTDGRQPILVFSDEGRSLGLVVDEIVDIVEHELDIELAGDRPGVLGYAIINGITTEIVDVGHFLPEAFAGWFRRQDFSQAPSAQRTRAVLLIDDSVFFRDMLTPLIEAAGFQATAVGSAAEALVLLKSNTRFDLVVTDLEMPGMDGFALARAIKQIPSAATSPIIGLAAMISPDMFERGRPVGLFHFVAKFDRGGLIAAIKELSADISHAA